MNSACRPGVLNSPAAPGRPIHRGDAGAQLNAETRRRGEKRGEGIGKSKPERTEEAEERGAGAFELGAAGGAYREGGARARRFWYEWVFSALFSASPR